MVLCLQFPFEPHHELEIRGVQGGDHLECQLKAQAANRNFVGTIGNGTAASRKNFVLPVSFEAQKVLSTPFIIITSRF